MMADWDYGGAYLRFPVEPETEMHVCGGTLMVHDIFCELPLFMKEADVIFTDGPWNPGNLRSFYTKAGLRLEKEFNEFTDRLFECVCKILPKTCYLEIGKEYLGEYLSKMKSLYPYVTLYNSTYYHKTSNICYVVQGSKKRKNWHYDGMDESDIITEVVKNEPGVIGDLCMGRGLVAVAAAKNGKRFVGTELNSKRLSVCLERLDAVRKKRL